MARFDINISGDKELEMLFKSLPEKIENKVLRQALRKAARPVLASAKAKLKGIRVTGHTTDPIIKGLKIRALKRRKGRIGVQVQTPTREELGLGDSKWYPPAHIELGTKRTPAIPYLRNSLRENAANATELIAQELRAAIERETKRG